MTNAKVDAEDEWERKAREFAEWEAAQLAAAGPTARPDPRHRPRRAYHVLARMPQARAKAARTRRRAGDPTRQAVLDALGALVRERGRVPVDRHFVTLVWQRVRAHARDGGARKTITRRTVERVLRAISATLGNAF